MLDDRDQCLLKNRISYLRGFRRNWYDDVKGELGFGGAGVVLGDAGERAVVVDAENVNVTLVK